MVWCMGLYTKHADTFVFLAYMTEYGLITCWFWWHYQFKVFFFFLSNVNLYPVHEVYKSVRWLHLCLQLHPQCEACGCSLSFVVWEEKGLGTVALCFTLVLCKQSLVFRSIMNMKIQSACCSLHLFFLWNFSSSTLMLFNTFSLKIVSWLPHFNFCVLELRNLLL